MPSLRGRLECQGEMGRCGLMRLQFHTYALAGQWMRLLKIWTLHFSRLDCFALWEWEEIVKALLWASWAPQLLFKRCRPEYWWQSGCVRQELRCTSRGELPHFLPLGHSSRSILPLWQGKAAQSKVFSQFMRQWRQSWLGSCLRLARKARRSYWGTNCPQEEETWAPRRGPQLKRLHSFRTCCAWLPQFGLMALCSGKWLRPLST